MFVCWNMFLIYNNVTDISYITADVYITIIYDYIRLDMYLYHKSPIFCRHISVLHGCNCDLTYVIIDKLIGVNLYAIARTIISSWNFFGSLYLIYSGKTCAKKFWFNLMKDST